MLFKTSVQKQQMELVEASRMMLKKMQMNDYSALLDLQSYDSPETKEIVQNVNQALLRYRSLTNFPFSVAYHPFTLPELDEFSIFGSLSPFYVTGA
ncbi:hypothetical protein [Niallia oryzisoli]|uniref:hypothetical protein n=1 Tax=Niallia oryzisoli TaxID=1737571 RepID=UPI0037365CD1